MESLRRTDKRLFQGWLAHLQIALPDLKGIRTVERADDRFRYLTLGFADGLEVPSWMASDGTLRLLALTLLAYLPDLNSICLIEEPENGIHPERIPAMVGNLRAAGLTGPAHEDSIVIASQDVRTLTPEYVQRMLPAARDMKPGVFCFNPPYGVRMEAEDEKQLLSLYSDMGRTLGRFRGWRAACFVANSHFVEAFGHAPVMTKPASNAALRGNFLLYEFR